MSTLNRDRRPLPVSLASQEGSPGAGFAAVAAEIGLGVLAQIRLGFCALDVGAVRRFPAAPITD